jgi:hypothetical protein
VILATPGLKLIGQLQDAAEHGGKRGVMTGKTYEEPEIRVLGEVTDLTQMSKPGVYFDYPFSSEGNSTPFPHVS